MKNIKLIIGSFILAGFLLGFSASKKALQNKNAHAEAAIIRVTDAHALEALSTSKSIVNSKKSDKAAFRSAIYHLAEASLSSNPQVQAEASALLQEAVRKLQQVDPDGYNINIYYKYLDDVEIFVNDYEMNQPFVSATDANGKTESYPYLTKGEINFSQVSKSSIQNSHVIELAIPGSKEKTRLYIDYDDYNHSEMPNQRGHQHNIIDPVK
ncbi:MAG: hypothetical protein R2753_05860 [Chitinophagales bacterium]